MPSHAAASLANRGFMKPADFARQHCFSSRLLDATRTDIVKLRGCRAMSITDADYHYSKQWPRHFADKTRRYRENRRMKTERYYLLFICIRPGHARDAFQWFQWEYNAPFCHAPLPCLAAFSFHFRYFTTCNAFHISHAGLDREMRRVHASAFTSLLTLLTVQWYINYSHYFINTRSSNACQGAPTPSCKRLPPSRLLGVLKVSMICSLKI